MKKVKQLLINKGHDVWSVEPSTSVIDAIRLMAEKEIGALLIMEGTQLVGMFSERDYARQIILKGRSSEDTLVSKIMATDIITATPCNDTGECMGLMNDNRVRHLPILENDEVIGIISIGDIVNSIIEEQRSTIVDLEKYISG